MLPLIFLLLTFPILAFAEKLYVVERERGSLAVVVDGRLVKEIEGLGNLNHATLKLWRGKAYLISRDGYLSQIDTEKDELLRKVKVGESAIGIDFTRDHIVVANYEPKTVVVLDEELNVVQSLNTGSRNVGIKGFEVGFVFSLMDRDEIWLVKDKSVKVFGNVGAMPFDALLKGNVYVVGFFKEGGVGLLDVKREVYRKVVFLSAGKEVVFKIPHFGTWGVSGDRAFIPVVGERRLYLVNLRNFNLEGHVELSGLPVFAVISPDGKYVAVNFSGDREDYVALVDPHTLEPVSRIDRPTLAALAVRIEGTRLIDNHLLQPPGGA
ncbi:MAG: NirF protein, partial [Aquificota bacterium]